MDTSPACVYAFLPNKTENTYRRFLDIILELAPKSSPDKILVDFEKAVIHSFAAKLPMSNLSGCYFHLTQNFNRKIAELGLKVLYQNNSELALAFIMIPALAFERIDRVEESFEKIVAEIMSICDQIKIESDTVEKIDQLLAYFQNFYIKSPLPGRNVMFPPFLWNQSMAAASGIA